MQAGKNSGRLKHGHRSERKVKRTRDRFFTTPWDIVFHAPADAWNQRGSHTANRGSLCCLHAWAGCTISCRRTPRGQCLSHQKRCQRLEATARPEVQRLSQLRPSQLSVSAWNDQKMMTEGGIQVVFTWDKLYTTGSATTASPSAHMTLNSSKVSSSWTGWLSYACFIANIHKYSNRRKAAKSHDVESGKRGTHALLEPSCSAMHENAPRIHRQWSLLHKMALQIRAEAMRRPAALVPTMMH